MPVDRAVRGLAHRRMIGEREVVVRAQVDELAPVGEPYHRLLRRAEHALGLVESLLAQALALGGQPLEIRLFQTILPGSGDYRGPIMQT